MKKNNIYYLLGLVLALLLPYNVLGFELDQNDQPSEDNFVRDIPKASFIDKGEFMLGLTASYGSITSENSSLLYLLSGIDASLNYGSIEPFVGYFYGNDKCIGLRMGYSTINANLDSGSLDFGDTNDLELDIPYVNAVSRSFNYSIFHRNYLGIDPKGSFGLFAEVELMVSDSQSTMSFDMGSTIEDINNKSFGVSLNFNPGIVVFVLDNVSTNVSIGLGGLGYTKVTQRDENGQLTGSRETSQFSLKFNITDINFGVTIHL